MRRFAVLLALLPALGPAQIRADHLYNGIRRPFIVNVRVPGRADKIEIRLLTPGKAMEVGAAEAHEGSNDLAKLFPELWATKKPRLLYAQVVADGRKIGSALVLQPMTTPPNSVLDSDGKSPKFVPDEDSEFAGYRAYVDQHLVLETSMGEMEFRLRPDCSPNTAFNIMEFVRGGLYTNTIWHRVVAKRKDGTPFVIQGGDPAGTGSGGPGFSYPLENSPLPHDFGVISMPRSTDPNTNGCQLFVCLSREGTKHLDGKYASFGQLLRGAEAVRKIAAVPVGKDDRPNDPPVIFRARLVEAGPYVGGF